MGEGAVLGRHAGTDESMSPAWYNLIKDSRLAFRPGKGVAGVR
jgi:hypothetical protein